MRHNAPRFFGKLSPDAPPSAFEANVLNAARNGHALLVWALLEDAKEANLEWNVNAQDGEGMTILHHAAAHGLRTSIRMLVNTGRCDYLIKDNYGRYASELAIEWAGAYSIARLLSKKQVEQAHRLGVPAFERPGITD